MAKSKATDTKALTKWDEKLAALAKASKAAVKDVGSGGNFLSLKGGNLSYQGKVIPGNKMNVIVVDWCRENQMYKTSFNEDKPQAPDCYAFGLVTDDIKEMAPNPENVAKPLNPTCHDCELRQWGSAEEGRGKACSEVARLALISEGDIEDIAGAEIAYLKVPVTSMAYWAGYVKKIADVDHSIPIAYVTEIAVVPQQKRPGWHIEFKAVRSNLEDNDVMQALFKRYEEVSNNINFPYPKFDEQEQAPAKGKSKPTAAPRRKF